jgi:hypothetical protein
MAIQPLSIPEAEAAVYIPDPEPELEIEEEPEPEPEPEVEPDIEYSPENLLNGVAIVGIREVKDGQFQSYLTGEWKDAGVSQRRPFGLVVPNNKPALPQYGLSKASIIYEAPVEGAVTRLLVVVEDYDDLTHIGPVRSARDYFITEAMGKNAFFCHWGLAVPYCADLINSSRVDNISAKVVGVDRGADEAFKRISRPGKALEFTGYMTIEGFNQAINRFEYFTAYSNDFVPQFTFAAENTRVEYLDCPEATKIYPGGTSSNSGGYGSHQPRFEYDATDNLYYRYQYGDKHIDEMNNQQLTVSNVVFQYMKGESRDAKGYLKFDVLGNGKSIIFTNGQVIEGTWRRDREDQPAKFYDELGDEVVLNQGKTWICVIRNSHAEHARYE